MPQMLANRAALAAGSTVRVNVRSVANTKKVRREKRNGRDVVIVPSATMPDDVVMNEIMYPAGEIAKGFASLERSPAPLGHPMINNKFVSAKDPEGINIGWIGGWNENVRQEGGRVWLDKVIDVEIANRSEDGKRVLEAIDQGEPVHTSTGLLAMLDAANGDVDYKFTARDIEFDHDAILLDEDGAATPEQGVGMMVNSKGQSEEVTVINSTLEEMIDQEIDFAGHRLVEALTRREHAGVWERMKSAILEAWQGSEREPSINRKEDDMAVSDEQFKALSDEVKTLSESVSAEALGKTIGEAVSNAVKPLVDAQNEVLANQNAKDEAELTDLRTKIVKANLLEEDDAKELTLNAARALAKKAEPGKAPGLNGAFSSQKANGSSFKLPAGEKQEA